MITPQQAQALLDKVKGTDESALQSHMDWKEVAQALETIAGLRVKYAVQVQTYSSGDQPYLTKTGGHTFDPGRANWFRGRGSARNHGMIYAPRHFRIVRRLVSEPEVAE